MSAKSYILVQFISLKKSNDTTRKPSDRFKNNEKGFLNMLSHKKIRKKGKIPLSKVFADIKKGDKVALVKDLSFDSAFPDRFQGRTGTVIGQRGKALIVQIYDGQKEKKFIVKKIHLKKLSS